MTMILGVIVGYLATIGFFCWEDYPAGKRWQAWKDFWHFTFTGVVR